MAEKSFVSLTRRQWVTGVAATGIAVAMPERGLGALSDSSEADRQIAKAATAALALQRRDWEQGTLAQAFLETGNDQQVVLLTKAAIVQREPDGRLGVVGNGSPTDPSMGGEAYLHAAKVTGDKHIQAAVDGLLDWILRRAPRSRDGILYHVFDKPEYWSDGLNGAAPFLAAAGHYDEALHQIDGYWSKLWDPDKKLLVHIWSDTPGATNKKEYWGGGNGWAAAGLARVIRVLPASYAKERTRLIARLRELVDSLLRFQRSDGLFHDMVDRSDTFVETNLAQMLAYSIYVTVAGGWLAATYRESADRMRKGARTKMDEFGLIQGASGAPFFDRPGISTEAQAFHMVMESAAKKLEFVAR